MASDKFPLRSEVWSARYDRGEREALAWHLWAESLAERAKALAQPVTGWVMPEDVEPGHEESESSEFPGSPASSDDRLFE